MITQADIQEALRLIRQKGSNYTFFFENLDDAQWIAPLAQEGFFKHPPEPIYTADTIQFPFWPESQFLAKVAAQDPGTISTLFAQLPATDNFRVYDDMAQAAITMPTSYALCLCKQLTKALRKPHGYFLPERLTSLSIALFKSGHTKEATKLCNALLSFDRDLEATRNSGRYEPGPLVGEHAFNKCIATFKTCLPTLIGLDAITLLGNVYYGYLTILTNNRNSDLTWFMRPAIENHDQNQAFTVLGAIVDAIRDVAITLLKTHSLDNVITSLSFRDLSLLKRVILHLLCMTSSPPKHYVVSYLVNRDHFFATDLHHEYFRLLQTHFDVLSLSDRDQIYRWIEEYCIEDANRARRNSPEEWTDADLQRAIDYRKMVRMTPLVNYLDAERKSVYDSLIETFGPPEHPDFLSYSRPIIHASASTVQVEELAQMDVGQIIQHVASFRPSNSIWDGPTEEDLARAIRVRIESDAAQFSSQTDALCSLPPTYIRHAIQGFESAVKHGTQLDLGPVLRLATFAITQIDDPDQQESRSFDKDPDWSRSRKAVAHFLRLLLSGGGTVPNQDFRQAIWELLERLAADLDPTPEFEAEFGGANMNPHELALNTTRPLALSATFYFMDWLRRCSLEPDDHSLYWKRATELLSSHLRGSSDSSLGVRSVYGYHALQALNLDPGWFLGELDGWFDRRAGSEALWHASWDTFVRFSIIFPELYHKLGVQYEHAVNLVPSRAEATARSVEDAILGSHLIWYFAHGVIGCEEGGILWRYLKKAPSKILRLALERSGRAISATDGELNTSILERLESLWEVLLDGEATFSTDAEFLSAFGWWVSFRQFEGEWVVGVLRRIAALGVLVKPEEMVLEQLVRVAETSPALAFDSLVDLTELMNVETLNYCRDSICQIVRPAIKGDRTLEANRYVHSLGAKGLVWARELLPG